MKQIKKLFVAIVLLLATSTAFSQITITNAGVTTSSGTNPWLALRQLASTTAPTNWNMPGTPSLGYVMAVPTQSTYSYSSGVISSPPFSCANYAGMWYNESNTAYPDPTPWNVNDDVYDLGINANAIYFRSSFNTPSGTLSTGASYKFTADDVADVWLNGIYLGSVYRTLGSSIVGVVGPTGYVGYPGAAQTTTSSGASSVMHPLIVSEADFNSHLNPAGMPNVLAIIAQNEWVYCRSVNVYTYVSADTSSPTTLTAIITKTSNCSDSLIGSAADTAGVYTGPYHYLWTWNVGGITYTDSSQVLVPTSSGNYFLTVTDALGNTATTSFNFTLFASLSSSITLISPPSCGGYNGQAKVNAIGGSAPYSYHWSNGETNQTVTDLGAGLYYVTVTSHNGCSAVASLNITSPCCTKPIAYLIINGDTVTGGGADTLCQGASPNIQIAGGTWAQFIIDGNVIQDSPTDSNWYFSVDSFILGGGFPIGQVFDSIPGLHTLCFIAATDSASPCADTICASIFIRNCCIKTTAQFTINGDSANSNPTICAGVPVVISTTTSGQYIQYYIDGGGPTMSSGIEPTPYGTSHDSLPASLATIGSHTLCVISFGSNPDSAGYMPCQNDTFCFAFTIACCGLSAQISLPDSTPCIGDTVVIVDVAGGPYFQIFVDSFSNGTGIIPMSSFPGGVVPLPGPNPNSVGTHTLYLVVYADSLGDCPDTASTIGIVKNCGCEFTYGTNFISSYSSGLTYTLYDSFTALQPNFINWIVDDSVWGQTGGADTFYHTFSPGFHNVCMQTATILTNADGSNICCYNTICDTVNIDACEYWKSTDTITYQLSTTNIDSVTFTFHGSTSPISPTIVWNFEDGTTLVSTDLTVTHVFSPNWVEKHKNRLEVCADIIWSKGDSINYDSLSVCCCLDHRCFPVFVSVCNIPSFNVELLSDNIYTGAYVFDVVSAPAGVVSIDMPSWISSDSSSTTDWTFEDDITYNTEYDICATFNYFVTYQDKPYKCPATTVCLDTFLSNPNPKDRFRAYPNPTTGQMVVEITNNTNAKSAKIEVSDVTGQVLLSTVNSLTTGINQKFMNLSNLSQGVYTIKMTIGNEQQIVKLVKE